jgi:hypothetical protein
MMPTILLKACGVLLLAALVTLIACLLVAILRTRLEQVQDRWRRRHLTPQWEEREPPPEPPSRRRSSR